MIISKIFLAALMMIVTTAIHAGAMMLTLQVCRRQHAAKRYYRLSRVLRVSGVIIGMFIVAVIEVVVWAVMFLTVGALDGIEKAVYFSMVTFTTLGYGDVLLNEQWRVLASFEAANGIIMFGWTTAIVMYVIRHLYFDGQVD